MILLKLPEKEIFPKYSCKKERKDQKYTMKVVNKQRVKCYTKKMSLSWKNIV